MNVTPGPHFTLKTGRAVTFMAWVVNLEPMQGPRVQRWVPLAPLTTLQLGGAAQALIEVYDAPQIVTALREAMAHDAQLPVFVLAGGSNVVIGDAGFAGTVVLVRSTGITVLAEDRHHVLLRVAAGHPLDELVAWCVARGYAGVECLSGIPGSVGATPIQNVGAYGQEIAEVVESVSVYDRERDAVIELTLDECGFAFRASVFKRSQRYVVLEVVLRLRRDTRGAPPRYGELSQRLCCAEGQSYTEGQRPLLTDVRVAVLSLRAGKGMVIDAADPDTRSAGSFFINPVISAARFARLADAVGQPGDQIPHWEVTDGGIKLAAAWLIEQVGFVKGHRCGGVGISSKHTLALVNYDGTTAQLLDLARQIRHKVSHRYGVELEHEPVLLGEQL